MRSYVSSSQQKIKLNVPCPSHAHPVPAIRAVAGREQLEHRRVIYSLSPSSPLKCRLAPASDQKDSWAVGSPSLSRTRNTSSAPGKRLEQRAPESTNLCPWSELKPGGICPWGVLLCPQAASRDAVLGGGQQGSSVWQRLVGEAPFPYSNLDGNYG